MLLHYPYKSTVKIKTLLLTMRFIVINRKHKIKTGLGLHKIHKKRLTDIPMYAQRIQTHSKNAKFNKSMCRTTGEEGLTTIYKECTNTD